MNRHDLKTDPAAFDAVWDGKKTYEIRLMDRAFAVGDMLVLRKTRFTGAEMAAGAPLVYTGDSLVRIITHILIGPTYGIKRDWGVLSIQPEDQLEKPLPEDQPEKESSETQPLESLIRIMREALQANQVFHTPLERLRRHDEWDAYQQDAIKRTLDALALSQEYASEFTVS